MRRAASPLVAVAACGSSKPYGLPRLQIHLKLHSLHQTAGDFAADFTLCPLAWGGNLLYN